MYTLSIFSAQLKAPVSYEVKFENIGKEVDELRKGKILWDDGAAQGYFINPICIAAITFEKKKEPLPQPSNDEKKINNDPTVDSEDKDLPVEDPEDKAVEAACKENPFKDQLGL